MICNHLMLLCYRMKLANHSLISLIGHSGYLGNGWEFDGKHVSVCRAFDHKDGLG